MAAPTSKRIAHLSDLHLGASAATERAARKLAATLRDDRPEVVIVSGDVTHRGRRQEAALFHDIFAEFDPIVVPGNHDRLGEVEQVFMQQRVALTHREGVSVLRIDSTGPHNAAMRTPQGLVTDADLNAIASALDAMPAGVLRVATLHHHPIFLPEDGFWEKVGGWLRVTRVEELHCGRELLALLDGRCDLVLSGHRHVAHHHRVGSLHVLTGGSATELGRYRTVTHDKGVLQNMQWNELKAEAKKKSAVRQPSARATWARASQPAL